jgi:hypothetical protein
MVADFNSAAQILIDRLLGDHPEWRPYAAQYGRTEDPEADEGSVMFSIPAPAEPKHRLEIALRGNTIEVAYDCGVTCAGAERQFIFSTAEINEAVEEVARFLRQVCAGDVVVVRKQIGRIARALRRDNVSEVAQFRSAEEVKRAPPGRYVAVHIWSAT